jgi:hypothetical protein
MTYNKNPFEVDGLACPHISNYRHDERDIVHSATFSYILVSSIVPVAAYRLRICDVQTETISNVVQTDAILHSLRS